VPNTHDAIETMTWRVCALTFALFGAAATAATACSPSAPRDADGTPTDTSGTTPAPEPDAGQRAPEAPVSPAAPAACVPSAGAWQSLVAGPGQTGYDAELAAKVARYDRLHEAVITRATGLAASVALRADPVMRKKLDAFLGASWSPGDEDPTDDLTEYTGIDPFELVTSWGKNTGMYAGSEIAADAFRYGVLRDRAGSCNEVARARKMLVTSLDALHVVVAITGPSGSIARSIGRKDLPGEGQVPTTPLFDGSGNPLPAEKNNGTWRVDTSVGGQYPKLAWEDSCSRDMLFGWTFGAAAAWEVIASDPTFPASTRGQLRADMKAVLDGLRKVRPSGKDLEIWDPDGRRAYNGNLHETSVDRQYILQNGVASMMALGEVAALASIVSDATSKAYLDSLVGPRGLPQATTQTMSVIALGGDQSNHSAFNMLFMTSWMAQRYVPDASVRGIIKKPVRDVYQPLFGENPSSWGQAFFDLVAAHAQGDGSANKAVAGPLDSNALARADATLQGWKPAPFYATAVENCDAGELASWTCTLGDGTTVVKLSTVKGGVLADKPVPIGLRPASNFYFRTSPFLVNGAGDPNVVYPGSDLRMAYWLGRWARVN
jgi:hypothetical protein